MAAPVSESVFQAPAFSVVAEKKSKVENFVDLVPDIFPSLDAIEKVSEDSEAPISRSEVVEGCPGIRVRFQLKYEEEILVKNGVLTICKNQAGEWLTHAPMLWPNDEVANFDFTNPQKREWVKNLIAGNICDRLPGFDYKLALADSSIQYRLLGLALEGSDWVLC